jgi:hypothetical protein
LSGPAFRIQLRGIETVQAEFRDINANQIPFATALAMTWTAQDSQHLIQEQVLPSRFTLRRVSFMKQGVRIKAATKTNLEATVQDIHPFMGLQETGGEKFPFGSAIAVPLEGARPSVGALIPENKRPKAVMAAGGFIRNGIMYAVTAKYSKQRRRGGMVGPMNASRQRNQIVPMYVLVSQASIKPRYEFEKSIEAIVGPRFQQNFPKAFAQAVRTARK